MQSIQYQEASMIRNAIRQKILGVDYTHLDLAEGGDLYLTDHGVPWVECLQPENFWKDRDWFDSHSEKLSGTSSLYRVQTKEINGKQLEIVFKWNRMGQDIPGMEMDGEFLNAEFNSPFEEFSLVSEMRELNHTLRSGLVIHKPLAIFVPRERVDLDRMGRKDYLMADIVEKHVEIDLDMHRPYGVIYEWIRGKDAIEAWKDGTISEDMMRKLTLDTDSKMDKLGFKVMDRKPHHIILRPRRNGSLPKIRNGDILCGIIDFELLQRTSEWEKTVKEQRRSGYLRKQRDRFTIKTPAALPSYLDRISIMGVDYIQGHCESTDGTLWVVGKDPDLFEYFLPERWEKRSRTRLSAYSEIYHTVTKDNINLVWRVSKVGVQPDMDPFKDEEKKILEFGYNSPFEEMALALKLAKAGIPTIYPRALYMTGMLTEIPDTLSDDSRYRSHEKFRDRKGNPILRKDRDYILIWGYWNGPDEKLADEDSNYYRGVDALRALREGLINQETYITLLESMRERMRETGVENLNLRGSHLLLSVLIRTGHLITDKNGVPEARICNFELLKNNEPFPGQEGE